MSVWGMPWENDLYTKIYIPEFERQNPGIKVRFHHFEDYGNKVKAEQLAALVRRGRPK